MSQTVYLKPQEALEIIFSQSTEVAAEKKSLTAEERSRVEKRLGYPLARGVWNFYIARSGKKIDGYALIDQEVGKTEPITFLTAISPQGEVIAVEILVYREPIGSEVKEKRFLRQFSRKGSGDPLKLGQDVQSMTGATLSARAVTRGVKRALLLWETLYGRQ